MVEAAIGEAVEEGKVWLLSGPASLLAEPIPAGVLTPAAKLRVRVEVGDGEIDPDAESTNAISKLLEGIRDDFKLQ